MEKFTWYYDKTYALVRQHLSLFDDHIEIATESLNDEAICRLIADFVFGRDVPPLPPKTHLNASVIDIATFWPDSQIKMNWLLGSAKYRRTGDRRRLCDYLLLGKIRRLEGFSDHGCAAT